MISTTVDLDRMLAALFSGALLPPKLLRLMFTLPPGDVRMPDGSPARYSTGPRQASVDSVTFWGGTGETHDYKNAAFPTRDQRRRFVPAYHPTAARNGEENQMIARVADLLTRNPGTQSSASRRLVHGRWRASGCGCVAAGGTQATSEAAVRVLVNATSRVHEHR